MFPRAFIPRVLTAGFLIAATAVPVRADSYADLQRAKAAFDGAHSWHAVERISTGQTIHLPMVMPQVQQTVDRDCLEIQPEVRSTLRDLGMQSFNGATLREYTFTSNGYPVQLYLRTDSYPAASVVQTPNGSVTIAYSRYNAPLTIAP